jgi:transposase
MQLYAGIDLHSNNNVLVILNDKGESMYQKRLENNLDVVLQALEPYKLQLSGVVVESTFNWYWLVDGLMERGYKLHLANTAAIQQYNGIKHTNDHTDAHWLAELLRLNLLPTGYIYPKEERSLRDLLRKRSQLVQIKTQNMLSMQNIILRQTGKQISGNNIKKMDSDTLATYITDSNVRLAVLSNLNIINALTLEIIGLEKTVLRQIKLKKEFDKLKTVPGIGDILGLTIMLETGDISRFKNVGNFASYCRCVDSKRLSNGKKKGINNKKNGNRFLSWAFIEAANFAIRFDDTIKKFYQRKMNKTKQVIALKTVAHKLARACYYIMRDSCNFEVHKAFT